jgi:hypothetical protein
MQRTIGQRYLDSKSEADDTGPPQTNLHILRKKKTDKKPWTIKRIVEEKPRASKVRKYFMQKLEHMNMITIPDG